jgi:hypothetical protein
VLQNAVARATGERKHPKQSLCFTQTHDEQKAPAEFLERLGTRQQDRDLPATQETIVAQVTAITKWGMAPKPTSLDGIQHPVVNTYAIVTPIRPSLDVGSDLSGSAIHVYFDTSDVRSILGGKKSYGGCNFLRLAEALHRYLLRPFVDALLREPSPFKNRSNNRSGCHRVDTNAASNQYRSRGSRKGAQCRLGCGIGARAEVTLDVFARTYAMLLGQAQAISYVEVYLASGNCLRIDVLLVFLARQERTGSWWPGFNALKGEVMAKKHESKWNIEDLTDPEICDAIRYLEPSSRRGAKESEDSGVVICACRCA